MKRTMEKISILSLSLVLTTSFSISSALPAMFDFYKDYPADKVELLVSLPSIGIMVMLLLNGLIERFLSERIMIVTGLLIMSACAFVPILNPSYNLVFLSRLIFGLGTGLINAKAISIISERYQGHERIQLLGYRGSAEVVGTALLTLAVGQLLRFGWTATFLAYAAGLVVLVLFLLFVPYNKEEIHESKHQTEEAAKLTRSMLQLIFFLAIAAAVIVCTNTAITFRIPSLMIEAGFGDAQLSSLVLSAMQLIGILAGISFSFLISTFKERLLLVAGVTFGIGQIIIALSPSLWVVVAGSILGGFAYSIALTTVFQLISERIPAKLLNKATSYAVLGCSFGASLTPFVLSGISLVTTDGRMTFIILGAWMIATSILVSFLLKKEA